MRLVLDTNVVASALLWGGVPRLLLRAGREERIELFTSTPLLAELTDILWRRKCCFCRCAPIPGAGSAGRFAPMFRKISLRAVLGLLSEERWAARQG